MCKGPQKIDYPLATPLERTTFLRKREREREKEREKQRERERERQTERQREIDFNKKE